MAREKSFVFGSTGSVLISAVLLEKIGHDVTIYDPGDHFQKEQARFLDPQVPAVPATEELKEFIEELAKLCGTSVTTHLSDLSPLHFDGESFASFIGYGDQKMDSIPAISKLNLNARWIADPNLETLMLQLLDTFTGKIMNYSEISKLHFEGNQITSVEINGKKPISADHFIFAHSPKQMTKLVPADLFSAREWSKINKCTSWSKLSLEMPLNHVEDWGKNQLAFLTPNKPEFEPWVGTPGQSPSRWVSYISEEKFESPELVGAEIKQLKKLISKAFKDSLDGVTEPRIHLQPESTGSLDWLEKGSKLEESLPNSLFISELYSNYVGLAASLEMAFVAHERFMHRLRNPEISIPKKPSLLGSNPLP